MQFSATTTTGSTTSAARLAAPATAPGEVGSTGIPQKVFPGWTAAITLVTEHGFAAARHAAEAARADDTSLRLDHAIRAMTSFDHAIDNTRKLPTGILVPGSERYFAGYEAAKAAVTYLIASGTVPGARERVGAQTMAAAREAFMNGVATSRLDRSRFGGHLAVGWLEATVEDAASAARMLRTHPETGRSLLKGIDQVRDTVRRRRALDEGLVAHVVSLFDRAESQLDAALVAAQGSPVRAVDGETLAHTGELLRVAERAARDLVAVMPQDASSLAGA